MIIQQPKQLKDNRRWKMVETSDEDSKISVDLCECTLGHSSAEEAKRCAEYTEMLTNPVVRAKVAQETKCYECEYFNAEQINTTLYLQTEISGTFKGTKLYRWCERPELQNEDEIAENYIDADQAEEQCSENDWKWFITNGL